MVIFFLQASAEERESQNKITLWRNQLATLGLDQLWRDRVSLNTSSACAIFFTYHFGSCYIVEVLSKRTAAPWWRPCRAGDQLNTSFFKFNIPRFCAWLPMFIMSLLSWCMYFLFLLISYQFLLPAGLTVALVLLVTISASTACRDDDVFCFENCTTSNVTVL